MGACLESTIKLHIPSLSQSYVSRVWNRTSTSSLGGPKKKKKNYAKKQRKTIAGAHQCTYYKHLFFLNGWFMKALKVYFTLVNDDCNCGFLGRCFIAMTKADVLPPPPPFLVLADVVIHSGGGGGCGASTTVVTAGR